MLRCGLRFLFHIPRTPAGATEARRVASHGSATSARFRRMHGEAAEARELRNGMRDTAAPASSPGTENAGRARSHHAGASPQHRRRPPGRTLRPGEPLPPPLPHSNNYTSNTSSGAARHEDAEAHAHRASYTSQREAYRQQRAAKERASGPSSSSPSFVKADVPGSYFTPLPRQYGFYDGVDEHGVEAPQPSRQERREQLRASLEAQAASVVEFTEGGEADIDLNGLPAEHYHGQSGWTTIPKESALYHSLYAAGELESRQRTNSWGVARRQGSSVGDLLGESGARDSDATAAASSRTADEAKKSPTPAENAEVLDDRRRRRQHDEGRYSTALEGELLAPTQESIGQPRSTYALRKMFVDGLTGYQGMISRAEEAAVSEELLHLLQSPRAAYIAEEARYCVNLYETELGIPGKDTLAFALSRCPTLQRVLYRFFFLGLIPAVPNVCQVSEMVGNFSGYPVHRHPRSIGAYVGLLNLVSTSVLHLQHKDAPWYPRLHLAPRSLFVVTEPCLSEYAMGYKQTQQPFHAFEYATRVSKDYRIEVLFATVETAQMPTLSTAVQLTEYAATKGQKGSAPLLEGSGTRTTTSESWSREKDAEAKEAGRSTSGAPLQGNTDAWLQELRAKLHAAGDDSAREKPMDGHALRRQLLAQHVVGSKTRGAAQPQSSPEAPSPEGRGTGGAPRTPPTSSSAAQRRLSALKARFDFAQNLKASRQAVEVSSEGPRLIRGHSPKDRHRGIK